MTEGEKMVWAAVFAREHSKMYDPGYITTAMTAGAYIAGEWEGSVTKNAIKRAGTAVAHMREACDDAGSVTGMLEEMLKGEN
jgi:hypothetical protein